MSSKTNKKRNEKLRQFFDSVYAEGSLAGGLLTASRPNDSADWNREADTELGKKNVKTFVQDFDNAAKLMANRR